MSGATLDGLGHLRKEMWVARLPAPTIKFVGFLGESNRVLCSTGHLRALCLHEVEYGARLPHLLCISVPQLAVLSSAP